MNEKATGVLRSYHSTAEDEDDRDPFFPPATFQRSRTSTSTMTRTIEELKSARSGETGARVVDMDVNFLRGSLPDLT
jgi:hypothetical protein